MEHTTRPLDVPGAPAAASAGGHHPCERPRSPEGFPQDGPPELEPTERLESDEEEEEGEEEQLGPSSAVPGAQAGPAGSSVSSAQRAGCDLQAVLHLHPCPVLGHVLLSSYAQAWARRCGIGPQRLEAARAGLVAAGALACTPLPQAPGLPPGLELWHTRADGIAALQAASTEEQLAVQACISGQSLAPGDILAAPPSALGASQSTSAAPAHARAARGERGGGRVIRNAGGGRVGAAPPPARPSSSSEEAPGYAGGGRWHGVLRKPHKATWMAEVELSPALADALGLGPKRANLRVRNWASRREAAVARDLLWWWRRARNEALGLEPGATGTELNFERRWLEAVLPGVEACATAQQARAAVQAAVGRLRGDCTMDALHAA